MSSAFEVFRNRKIALEQELQRELEKENDLNTKIKKAKDRLRLAEEIIEEREPRKHELTEKIDNIEASTEIALQQLKEAEERTLDIARENTYIFRQGNREIKQLENRLQSLTRNYLAKNSEIEKYNAKNEVIEPRLIKAEERLAAARSKQGTLQRKLDDGKYKIRVSEQMREVSTRKERYMEDLQWAISSAEMRYDMAIKRTGQLEEILRLKLDNLEFLKSLRERTFKENYIRRQKLMYDRKYYHSY